MYNHNGCLICNFTRYFRRHVNIAPDSVCQSKEQDFLYLNWVRGKKRLEIYVNPSVTPRILAWEREVGVAVMSEIEEKIFHGEYYYPQLLVLVKKIVGAKQ